MKGWNTMKKYLALLLALAMLAAALTGCGEAEKPEASESPESSQTNTDETPDTDVSESTEESVINPEIPGERYDTGEFQVLVPENWAAFPITDAFSENSDIDTSCLNIILGGTSDLDLFSKPYVRLDYYGPDTMMMNPSSEYYENVQDVAPMKLGGHTWTGFIGDDGYGTSAVLWMEEGDIQAQAIIWLEAEEQTVSLEDPSVQAILASVQPSDGTASSETAATTETADTGSFVWWETSWYGWWPSATARACIRCPASRTSCGTPLRRSTYTTI